MSIRKFNKTTCLFPVKRKYKYFSHCGISPFFEPAAKKACDLIAHQTMNGSLQFPDIYPGILANIKVQAAELLQTNPDHMAMVKNTSEAMSMVANGYPFKSGDEIISFEHEYPANHYPWRLQEKFKGVKLILLKNQVSNPKIPVNLVGHFSTEELLSKINEKTRMIAISHVQFTSGFAADLKLIGKICQEHNIDLVVDAAQSMGALPLYPEEWNISAIATAGWKWLLGPFGTGLFYTTPAFRNKLRLTQVGAETMRQGIDFLNHAWDPHETAKRFEYSSTPFHLAGALAVCLEKVHNQYGPKKIKQEIFRLQDLFLDHLNNEEFIVLKYKKKNRSGILSLFHPEAVKTSNFLLAKEMVCTVRGGYLRIAPHFYNTDKEMIALAKALNKFTTS